MRTNREKQIPSNPIHLLRHRTSMPASMLRLAFAVLVALCASCLLSAQAVLNLPSATIKRVDGKVEVVDKGGAVFAAYLGSTVLPGQILRAGWNGSAELDLAGIGAVRVEANSEVKVPEANEKTPPPQSLEMLKGKLFLNISAEAIKKQGNREFRLKTPVAVLAVKGTKFFAFASGQGDTIGVHEGMVLAQEPQGKKTQELKAGTAAEASPNKLSAPRALNPVEQAYGFIYPGAPILGWVVPIENGERCLTIGFIQTSNGDRYFLRKRFAYLNEDDALWKESIHGKRELVFQCQYGKDPRNLQQILAGPGDTIYVTSRAGEEPGLYQIVGKTVRLVSKWSALIGQMDQKDQESLMSVAFGRKPDGTIDPKGFYFGAGKCIYRSTLTSRNSASPPVLAYPDLKPDGFSLVGAADLYVAERHLEETADQGPGGAKLMKTTPDAIIQHLKDSQDRKDLTTIAQLPVFPDVVSSAVTIAVTMGVWPLVGKPKP